MKKQVKTVHDKINKGRIQSLSFCQGFTICFVLDWSCLLTWREIYQQISPDTFLSALLWSLKTLSWIHQDVVCACFHALFFSDLDLMSPHQAPSLLIGMLLPAEWDYNTSLVLCKLFSTNDIILAIPTLVWFALTGKEHHIFASIKFCSLSFLQSVISSSLIINWEIIMFIIHPQTNNWLS